MLEFPSCGLLVDSLKCHRGAFRESCPSLARAVNDRFTHTDSSSKATLLRLPPSGVTSLTKTAEISYLLALVFFITTNSKEKKKIVMILCWEHNTHKHAK